MSKTSDPFTSITSEYFSRIPFAENLSKEGRLLLHEGLRLARYQQGKYFKLHNERLKNLPIILSGSLRVYVSSQSGKSLTLYRLYPDDTCVLAVYCILNDMMYPADAIIDQTTEMFLIPANIFNTLYEKERAVQDFVFSLGLDRIMELIMTAQEVAFKKLDKRLAQYLIEKFLNNGNKDSILKMSHQEIADDLGTAREVVSRILSEFEKNECISLTRMQIALKDQRALQQIAEG